MNLFYIICIVHVYVHLLIYIESCNFNRARDFIIPNELSSRDTRILKHTPTRFVGEESC